MGNAVSAEETAATAPMVDDNHDEKSNRLKYKSFPGSAVLEKTFCGSIDTTDPSEYEDVGTLGRLLKRAEVVCISSPVESDGDHRQRRHTFDDEDDDDGEELNSVLENNNNKSPLNKSSSNNKNKAGRLLARALVSEVSEQNPHTFMKADRLQERERQLLRAQHAATVDASARAVGRDPTPHVLRSLSRACTGEDDVVPEMCPAHHQSLDNDNANDDGSSVVSSPFQVTIGLALSRRSAVGHARTVTRQTAFDLNELQDREHKYISGCAGWNAGGGEPDGAAGESSNAAAPTAKPDTVHIPIIHIDCPNQEGVDLVISALASGEVFIPHMAVQPESLSSETTAHGTTNVTVRFGCERRGDPDDGDVPPDQWPNWCLEFMHNQLYDYFYGVGARWMKRPFQIVLAESVRWKTVKHMNRFFAHGEAVIAEWRQRGPQYLDPVASQGATAPEECRRPHGIYLFQKNNKSSNGGPTNYFAPNFEPPYTTKMTRSLLLNVLSKSWDGSNREWSSQPVPHVVTPSALMAAACGCSDRGGFVAKEVTTSSLQMQHRVAVAAGAPLLAAANASSQQQQQQQQQRLSPYHQSSSHHQDSKNNMKTPKSSATSTSTSAQILSPTEHSKVEFSSDTTNDNRKTPAIVTDAADSPQVQTSSSASASDQQSSHQQNVLLAKSSDVTSGASQKENMEGEKKTEDATAAVTPSQRQRYATAEEDLLKFTQKKGFRVGGGGLSDATAASGNHNTSFSVSVAGTETTVMHANKRNSSSSNGSKKKESSGGRITRSPIHRGKVLYSDEDFLAELSDTETEPKQPLSTKNASPSPSNVKTTNKLKQRNLVDLTRSGSSSPTKLMITQSTSSSSNMSGGKMMRANYSMHHQSISPRNGGGNHQSISPRNGGGNNSKTVRHSESLDYSTDGSSLYFRNDSQSLIGQDYTSVAPTVASPMKNRPSSLQEVETEEESLLSIQESASSTSQSVVPTDEELYSVGWAKALDPSSGNYYYFTLDRTRTVWENPLSQSQWGGELPPPVMGTATATTKAIKSSVDP